MKISQARLIHRSFVRTHLGPGWLGPTSDKLQPQSDREVIQLFVADCVKSLWNNLAMK